MQKLTTMKLKEVGSYRSSSNTIGEKEEEEEN